MNASVQFELFSTSFCGACRTTRAVLDRAIRLIPGSSIIEHSIEAEPTLAERHEINASPTVIIRSPSGAEVLRARGVPTINQVLSAAAHALNEHKEPL